MRASRLRDLDRRVLPLVTRPLRDLDRRVLPVVTRPLRDLDRRVLPAAARGLRTAVDGTDAVLRRAVGGSRRAAAATPAGLAAWADRVDRRYASSGPLGLLRDVPQLALLLVAAVFASGAFAAAWLAEPAGRPTGPAGGAPSSVRPVELGVPPGVDVGEHLAGARADLEQLAAQRPDQRYVALVSLDRYLPVGDLPALVRGTDPRRVYLRAPGVERAATVEAPLTGTAIETVLPALCGATAGSRLADAESLRSQAATIEGATPEERAQRADDEAEAARLETEAAAYGGACATAFAVVVEAKAAALRELLTRPGVRGVETAPDGAGRELAVAPLLPEASGRLPTGNER